MLYAQNAVGPNPVHIALFPLVAQDVPASSDASNSETLIGDAVENSSSGKFSVSKISDPPEDPGVPPDPTTVQDIPYSLTSQLFYDSSRQETQAQVWLYDDTSETMLVTDQMVYATADEAAEFFPSLIDYILTMIPSYDIHVSTSEGGTISYEVSDTDKYDINNLSPLDIVQQGAGTISITATPGRNKKFDGWKISYNGTSTTQTEPALKLEVNSKTYPGIESDVDPYGLKTSISIEASFSESKGTKANAHQWYLGLDYLPLVSFADKGSILLGNTFNPIGLALSPSFIPWNFTWGSLGFRLDAAFNYFTIIDEEIKDSIANAGYLSLALGAVYKSPVFVDLITINGHLGAGAAFLLGQYENLVGSLSWLSANNSEQRSSSDIGVFILAGADVQFNLVDYFYLSTGIDYQFMFTLVDIKQSFSMLRPKLGFGFKL
ncbi:MAG: hypothetical protein LBM77_07165 [Spirochaetaceae bacterium]|nr:hypothetical protein [Spirochaetaceae bacterium]